MKQYPAKTRSRFSPKNIKQMQINISLNKLLTIIFGITISLFIAGAVTLYITKNNMQTKSTTVIKAINTDTVKSNAAIISEVLPEYNLQPIYAGKPINQNAISLRITYDDGHTEIIKSDKITMPDNIDTIMQPGLNSYSLIYNDKKYILLVTAEEAAPIELIDTAYDTYTDEYNKADYKYSSDTLFCTITRYTEPDIYWLAHIIVSPDNLPQVIPCVSDESRTNTMVVNSKSSKWIIGINGSYYNNDICKGTYILYDAIIKDEPTTGNELCIASDGTLFTPKAGLTAKELLQQGVKSTALSENPVLIRDGNLREINYKKPDVCKTVIGMVQPYEYYMLVASNGTPSSKISFNEIGQILYDKKCTYAKALSGAENTGLVFKNEMINKPSKNDQKVADVVAIY